MEDMALAVFRRGHLPALGEWFALPLLPARGRSAMRCSTRSSIPSPAS
jgi:hypothetical protein